MGHRLLAHGAPRGERRLMDPKPLDWVLDTLARAECFGDPDDREACERIADALRTRLQKITGPVRVLLVHGPDADPLVQWAEELYRGLDDAEDQIRNIRGMAEDLRDELVERRKRITAERDHLRKAIEHHRDSENDTLPYRRDAALYAVLNEGVSGG